METMRCFMIIMKTIPNYFMQDFRDALFVNQCQQWQAHHNKLRRWYSIRLNFEILADQSSNKSFFFSNHSIASVEIWRCITLLKNCLFIIHIIQKWNKAFFLHTNVFCGFLSIFHHLNFSIYWSRKDSTHMKDPPMKDNFKNSFSSVLRLYQLYWEQSDLFKFTFFSPEEIRFLIFSALFLLQPFNTQPLVLNAWTDFLFRCKKVVQSRKICNLSRSNEIAAVFLSKITPHLQLSSELSTDCLGYP